LLTCLRMCAGLRFPCADSMPILQTVQFTAADDAEGFSHLSHEISVIKLIVGDCCVFGKNKIKWTLHVTCDFVTFLCPIVCTTSITFVRLFLYCDVLTV